jgi:transposase
MMIIGCDFHPRFQQIAFVDQETGECGDRRLNHPEEAEQFYRSLAGRQVRIGAEATGNFRWFRHLMDELGHEFLLGDATAIRAACPRRQKTDKRDARHILSMLVEDRFPAVWQPPVENDHVRQLLLHRCRMVRMRTKVKNQLDSMAKNEGVLSSRVWSPKRRSEIEALPLPGWYAHRRADLLGLLEELDKRIKPLDEAVREAAEGNQEACLLMTHPGVGPIVSLAFVLTIGDWRRFPRGKQVGSYLGLIPEEESSGNKRRLGQVSKQGNSLVRWLLVEAATTAQRYDASWHRQYVRLSMTKHHGVAKVAIAHKLAVRLYWMLRSGDDYSKGMERGSYAGQSV